MCYDANAVDLWKTVALYAVSLNIDGEILVLDLRKKYKGICLVFNVFTLPWIFNF